MKTMKPLILFCILTLLPLVGPALTVECVDLGNTLHPFEFGSFEWDYCYKITLDVDEQIDWFHVGVGAGCQISNFEVVDVSTANLVNGWFGVVTSGKEDRGSLVDHDGSISTKNGTTDNIALWATYGSSISNGVYYFGFDCPDPEGVFGFLARSGATPQLVEDWDDPVGLGTGPVHAPIPEPATLSLLSFVAVVIFLFRRQYFWE